ncbi:carbohydrate kinase [Rhodobacter sp. NTK016B]|uniref:carbohydrate kinase family protein n=1 Tax=Rhodobacter sp. NTK016B TaxID=2759676 RepID=UPI001A8CC22E|nr:carbohydrate kinase [Rhodobacter sp. NTK016B]MBN8290474.1 carbohydrate kinase [Rhodobacter sp. NTK016B]
MILCCGEALIDMLPDSSGAFAPHPGGAVFNTAIALGRLGAPARFLSGLSADFFGDMLRDRLTASQVDTGLCVTSDRPCTLAFVRLVDGHATYAFYDENTAGRMLSPEDLPAEMSTLQPQALFFGGISLVVEPCGTTYEGLMTRAARDGHVTMIDPNIRPGFITDETAYRARLDRMLALADIVKISLEDLDWLARGEGEAYVARLLNGATSVVFLTDGGVGATAVTRRGRVFEPAQRVSVVDTVGAGDTFNAGVLASLREQGELSRDSLAQIGESALARALKTGAAAAAVTVSRAGANPPWASELTL